MIVYLESSALVKVVLAEEQAEVAVSLWEEADQVTTSRLTYPEARAAMAAAVRDGRMSSKSHRAAKRRLTAHWEEFDIVELVPRIAAAAGDLAERSRLRGGDAIHLASALDVARGEFVLATWDQELARAAERAGLNVAPPPG